MSFIYSSTESQVIELARDELYSQMLGLMEAMDADDVKPLAIYDTHEILIANLPCFSIGIDNCIIIEGDTTRSQKTGSNTHYDHEINATIRTHTNWDYPGAFMAEQKNYRLLESIKNWLCKHDPGNDFTVQYMETITTNQSFVESLTVGGFIEVQMKTNSQLTIV